MKKTLCTLLTLSLLLTACGREEERLTPAETLPPEQTEPIYETPAPTETTEAPRTEETAPPVITEAEPPTLAETPDVRYDIELRASEHELTVGQDEPEVIWYAEVPVECSPQTVLLIDADTGETAAVLYDLADYETYGDTIQGDSVYNCRFPVDFDFGTDPDASEHVTHTYYAAFTEDGITHRSEDTELSVYEPFTDKELAAMEEVEDAVQAFRESEDYQNLSTEDEKAAAVMELLESYGDVIEEDSIRYAYGNVTYRYAFGVTMVIMLRDFDPMKN